MQKKTQAIAVLTAAMLLAGAAGASALEIKSGNDKVDLQLKGHVNRVLMHVDDGNDSKLFHVDNTNSETRVGVYGKLKASETLTVGSNFELQWQANPSDKVSMEEESIEGDFKERLAEVYFTDEHFGSLFLGRGDMNGDDSSEADLSGTDLAGNSGVTDVGAGFRFHDPAALAPAVGEAPSGFTVKDVFNSMDGTRKNRVRYDTPRFAGLSLGGSVAEQEMVDAALRYSQKFADTKVEGVLCWSDPGENGEYSQINGSASVLFGSGFNLTAAGGTRDMDKMPAGGDEPVFMYGKIGYLCDQLLPTVGQTAVSVDYGVFENAKKQNIEQEGTAVGVQLVQTVSDWSTELYAAYRGYQLEDNTSADYEDISIVMGGARFKF